MTQTRIYDYGSFLTQGRKKTLAAKLFPAGVYEGLEPTTVTNTLLTLSAGAFLMPSGVLTVEDTAIEIPPPDAGWPGVATNYTLTAEHSDIQAVGGSVVTYVWNTGLLARTGAPNASSLALLWVRHPGSTPLDASMLSLPEKVRGGAGMASFEDVSGWLQAPFAQTCDVYKGSNITVTPASHTGGAQNLGVLVSNTSGGTQTYQFRIPLPVVPRARSIEVYATLPSLGSLSISAAPVGGNTVTLLDYEVVAADGSAVTPTPTSVSGPVTSLATAAQTFVLESTEEAPVSLGVTMTLPATSSAFLKGFRVIGD